MLAKFHGRRKTLTGAPTVATTTSNPQSQVINFHSNNLKFAISEISKNDRWIFDNGRRHIESGFAEKSEKRDSEDVANSAERGTDKHGAARGGREGDQ